jgi:hypothetical protein
MARPKKAKEELAPFAQQVRTQHVVAKRTSVTAADLRPEVLESNNGLPMLANGRKVVLGIINTILTDPNNVRNLHSKMQDEFDANPVGFYQDIVYPLMPKQMSLEAEGEGNKKARLNIVLTAGE